jgi:hypothetical protein
MTDDPNKPRPGADADLEREIRAERKFSLAEAIGRMAGPGAMKGVSPVTREQQAVGAIREYLDHNLADPAGVLAGVLLNQVEGSERLLASLDRPLAALAGHVRQVLGSEFALKELVREADAEWGRVFGERPRFDRDGCPPAPDDPYTHDSVRAALAKLAGGLEAAGGGAPA